MRQLRKTGGAVVLALAWSLGAAHPGSAQAVFGNIIGTVTDATGAAVSNARVTVTEIAKGVSYSTTTNESGNYFQTHLVPGIYEVRIEADGFRPHLVDGVSVSVNSSTRVDAQLQVGPVLTEVTVAAAPPLVQTDRAEVSHTLSAREISELPVLNRNFTQLQLLIPGTTKMPWQHADTENPQGSIQINTNGQLFGMSNFMIDGTDNNDPVLGIIVVNPKLDAVQEFKMTTSNYDAEFAQAGGAVIQVETKSGTNELHGSLFHFLQNNVFKARNPFSEGLRAPGEPEPKNRGVPPLRWNQFGGSVGGPIIRNKLFFFGDYQGTRRRLGGSVLTRVPTLAERQGDFSAFGIPIFDPRTGNADGTGRTRFADPSRATPENPLGLDIIPLNRIAPQATALLDLLPMPNLRTTNPFDPNFVTSGVKEFDDDQFDIRVDHYLGDRLRWFTRYSFADFSSVHTPAFGKAGGPGLSGLGSAGESDVRNQNGVIGFNYTFNPTLITDFRFGATRYRVNVLPLDFGENLADQVGLPGLNFPGRLDTSGLPFINVAGDGGWTMGFGLRGGGNGCNCPLFQIENQFQWVNNWTKITGNHAFRWGADLRRLQNRRIPSDWHRSGNLFFREAVTGSAEAAGSGLGPASFLLGLPSEFFRFASQSTRQGERQTRMYYFGQDTWRVTPKLTLSLGLRWDTWLAPTVSIPGLGGRYDAGDNLVRIPGVGNVDLAGDVETRWTNFSPRFGIAYAFNPRTVVRAGWGRSYFQGIFGRSWNYLAADVYPVIVIQQVSPASPFTPVFSVADGPPAAEFPVIPSNGLLPLADGIATQYIPRDQRIPYADSWNLTVEHELANNLTLSAAYVGNAGFHLNHGRNMNAAVPGPGDLNSRRPLWNLFGVSQSIDDRSNASNSNYNALQLKANKRFSENYSFLASYTFSRAFNYGDFGVETNPFNRRLDYGPAGFDREHVFTVGHTALLPFGPGQRWLADVSGPWRHLVEGWQWNGITLLASGYPFSPVLSNNASLNADMGLRPNLVGNPTVENPTRDLWFNPAAFAAPGPFQFGNAPRNMLRAPGLAVADWSLFKNFNLTEQYRLQFRWEVFNAFNRTNLSHFVSNAVDTGTAGKIFDIAEPMRNMQFALRLTW